MKILKKTMKEMQFIRGKICYDYIFKKVFCFISLYKDFFIKMFDKQRINKINHALLFREMT